MHVPYDPDFDKPTRRPWGDVFVALGAIRSFWIGAVLSLLIAGTLGFVIMLSLRA